MRYIQVTKRTDGILAYINVEYITSVSSYLNDGKEVTTIDCNKYDYWEVRETVDEVMEMIDEVSK